MTEKRNEKRDFTSHFESARKRWGVIDGVFYLLGGWAGGQGAELGLKGSMAQSQLLRIDWDGCKRIIVDDFTATVSHAGQNDTYNMQSHDASGVTVCASNMVGNDPSSAGIQISGLTASGQNATDVIYGLNHGATKVFELAGKVFYLRVEDVATTLQNQIQYVDISIFYNLGKDGLMTTMFNSLQNLAGGVEWLGAFILVYSGAKFGYNRLKNRKEKI